MSTKVLLIRHGETTGIHERRYKGHIDVPLSENGIKQIRQLAEYLENNIKNTPSSSRVISDINGTLNALYTSDLSRAVDSAELIARPFGLKPIIMKELRERHFGHWEGMTFEEIKEQYPDEFNAWARDPLEFSPIGGESTEDVSKRIMPVFNNILQSHLNHNLVIMSHGGVNRVILCNLLGIPLQYIFRIEQDFACINLIEFYGDNHTVKVMNYTVDS